MYKALIDTIGKEYPEVHYDNLGPVFPPYVHRSFSGSLHVELMRDIIYRWAEIDWENPSKSLYLAKGET